MTMKRWISLFAAAGVLSLAACSSEPKKEEVDEGPAGLSSFEEEVDLDLVWRLQVGKGQGTAYARIQPALWADKLYVADAYGLVSGHELADAEELWKVNLNANINSAIGVSEKHVYVVTDNGVMHALNRSTGESDWAAEVQSEVLAAPVFSEGQNEGLVAVQSVDGKLRLYEAKDGKQRWTYDSNLPKLSLRGTSAPVFYEDQLIVGFANGKVVGLNLQDGSEKWSERIGIPAGRSELERLVDVDGRLLVRDETLFVVGYQGQMAAIDLRIGKMMWKRDASSYHGPLYGLGNLYVLSADDELQAFDERSGSDVWNQPDLRGRQLTEPVFLDNYIAVADFEGYVHLLKQLDGAVVGRAQVKRPAVDWVRGGSYNFKHPSRYFDLDAGIRTRLVATGDYLLAINNSGFLNLFQIDQ